MGLALCLACCRAPEPLPDPIAPILEDFESDDPNVREAAGERLRVLAPAHEARLRALLRQADDPEVRARIEDALRPPPAPSVEWLQPARTYSVTVVSAPER